MIPAPVDYYLRRAREHRILARNASSIDASAMHQRLQHAYVRLADRNLQAIETAASQIMV